MQGKELAPNSKLSIGKKSWRTVRKFPRKDYGEGVRGRRMKTAKMLDKINTIMSSSIFSPKDLYALTLHFSVHLYSYFVKAIFFLCKHNCASVIISKTLLQTNE